LLEVYGIHVELSRIVLGHGYGQLQIVKLDVDVRKVTAGFPKKLLHGVQVRITLHLVDIAQSTLV